MSESERTTLMVPATQTAIDLRVSRSTGSAGSTWTTWLAGGAGEWMQAPKYGTSSNLPAYSEDDIRAMQKKAFESAVAPVRKLFQKAGVSATEVCLAGNPADEIAAYAKKKKLDVLVMGSHGYGAFKAAVMGSVATRVAHTADVPLLLVRRA